MTVLAETNEYLVEFEQSPTPMLTISRYSDGCCKAMTGKGLSSQFKDCLKTHSAEKVTQTFLKLANTVCPDWGPMYKPKKMPRFTQTNTLWVRHRDCQFGHVWIKHSRGAMGKLRKIRQKLIFTDGWECEIR